MKEVMKNKLSKVQDLEDRRLLKDILTYSFSELIDYCDSSYNRLTEAVYDQIEGEQKSYQIYTTVLKRSEYDPIDHFMFPMRAEDLEDKNQVTDDILSALQEKGTACIGRTFLQCDYLELKKILNSNSQYAGEIVTETGTTAVTVTLKKSDYYTSCVRELYYDFLANGMEWTSIHAPYIEKYVEFQITECEGLSAGEEIQNIKVDLGEIESLRQDSMIPLWNLEPMELQSMNFPIPTQDNVHFQHRITLNEKNESYQYIVQFGRKNEYDGYCVRDSESVSIILALDAIDYWPAYRIKKKEEDVIYDYPNPLCSNGCHNTFMVHYVKQQAKTIRTKAELIRKILSYEGAQEFKIGEIQFLQPGSEFLEETYSVNPFIEEDIRIDNSKQILLVEFKTEKKDYMTRDHMSFLLSEVQSYFPEYKCEGRML